MLMTVVVRRRVAVLMPVIVMHMTVAVVVVVVAGTMRMAVRLVGVAMAALVRRFVLMLMVGGIARGHGTFSGRNPDRHGANSDQQEQSQPAPEDRLMKRRVEDIDQRIVHVGQDQHHSQGAADANGAELVQVIRVLLFFVRMHVHDRLFPVRSALTTSLGTVR
jgi:hypothetical protein